MKTKFERRPQFAEGSIERLENVSAPLILKWIKGVSKIIKDKLNTAAESINEENFKKENIEILEIDENES